VSHTLGQREGRGLITRQTFNGGQHFANEDAYRRDRRKDALLQEHGYFVLRFSVQDIGVKLDYVLDTILRVLTHLRRRRCDH